MSSHDEDRIAYLAGEDAGPLTAAERAELDQLRGHLKRDATWVEPDSGLEDRIVAAVALDSGSAGARRGGLRSGARRPQRRALADRLGLRAPGFALGALTAALVAVVIALSSGGGSGAPEFAAAISGTPLAPTARGNATLTKTPSGWRIQLSATGLPRLANGRYYQAWLKSPAGVLVPVGTFNDARKVTLWAGVAPSGFPELTVTRQRADGNPASSGERVLLGPIRAQH
jgi:Anti-sigma-K factor rskA, C-terminal